MTADLLKRFGWFALFLLAQVVLLQQIHLFGVATPFLYVYFVLQFPRTLSKWSTLLWGFSLGLLVDIFANTPGVAAASLTLLTAIQPYYLGLFVSQDAPADLRPSLKTMGFIKYTIYSATMVLLFCVVFFSLEQFSFFHILHWLMCVTGSAVITLLLIYSYEFAKKK
jgi:rod shape-determining protein MreD